MPCYRPIPVWRGAYNENGKQPIVFNPRGALSGRKLEIPCGKCPGCKMERSKQWSIRLIHEKSLHTESSFITLTYDEEHLPRNGSLDYKDFQLFMKRLRKRHAEKNIRFFQCGEYGEKLSRPHHHAIIFGHHFRTHENSDLPDSDTLYSSEELKELWPHGHNTVGDVSVESCAYVAGYITKKILGKKAYEHYRQVDKKTGEMFPLKTPEFVTMSRKPGIGSGWYDKFKTDVYPHDKVIIKGKENKPPKYYDKKLELDNKGVYDKIKELRVIEALAHREDSTPERLKDREKVHVGRQKIYSKRSYENA